MLLEYFYIVVLQEKENQSGSPEKQVDKESINPKDSNRDLEIEDTQFSALFRALKQPTRLPKTMSENLSVPLAFIGQWSRYLVFKFHISSFQPSFTFATRKVYI